MGKGRGLTLLLSNWTAVLYRGWGMPGRRAGSPVAVYAWVQCREPKGSTLKKDETLCSSGYIIYLWQQYILCCFSFRHVIALGCSVPQCPSQACHWLCWERIMSVHWCAGYGLVQFIYKCSNMKSVKRVSLKVSYFMITLGFNSILK